MKFDIKDRKTILLCLIGSGGSAKQKNEEIEGSIKLMKESFLLQREVKTKFPYNFVPYDFGPCSFDIYEDLNEFIEEGIVKEEKNDSFSTYSISNPHEEFVSELIDNLDHEVREAILKIKKEFNKLSYYALISYVYKEYPQFTKASKFNLY